MCYNTGYVTLKKREIMRNNEKTSKDKLSFDNLISIRSDCLKHIFELESLNWKSVTTLSTITTAILLLMTSYPNFKYLGLYVIFFFNFIGIQILFRNRSVFLQNIFLMSQIEEKLPYIGTIRPKDWNHRNIEAFDNAFPTKSHWASLVLTHVALIIGAALLSTVLLWVELFSNGYSSDNLVTFLECSFIGVFFPGFIIFLVLYFRTYRSYKKWFEKRKKEEWGI